MNKIIFRNLTNVRYQQLKNAISKDKARPHLQAVFLDIKESKIVVTDTQILMTYDIEIIHEDDMKKEILIDPKLFNQSTWISVPKDDLQLVEFHATEEKTEVKLGEEVVAVAKNIDTEAAFPQYKHVFTDHETMNEFCANSDSVKRLVYALPSAFDFPKFKVGRKLHISSEFEHHEFGEMTVKGIAMTVGFGEDEITNETIEFKINRDKHGKIFSGEFKKVEGKKLSRRVLNTWMEDFVDEDSGEAISIERNEIVVDKNTIIDADVWERIDAEKSIDYLYIHKYDN